MSEKLELFSFLGMHITFFPSIVHYHTVFAFFFLALENFSPIFAKNFPRFSQKLGENGKKFPPFLKK